jgi:tetratricopeptide (TPR) repeat protein
MARSSSSGASWPSRPTRPCASSIPRPGRRRPRRLSGLLRAGDLTDEALQEFRYALRCAGKTEFKARAGLEIGHIERRRRDWRAALDAYLAVAADPVALARRREDAWLWSGRVWQEQGRLDDARMAWKRVADEGTDTILRIRAFDELGLLALANEDVEAAAGWLERCLRAVSQAALEETLEGERARDALLRMRLVDELTRVVESRKHSSAGAGTSRNP